MNPHRALPVTQRIAFRQARLAFILAVILGTLTSLTQIYINYQDHQSVIRETLNHLVETTKVPAAEALWHLDEDQARSVINGLFNFQNILEVRLVSTYEDVNVGRSRAIGLRPYEAWSHRFFGSAQLHSLGLSVDLDDKQREVGTLYLLVDPYHEAMAFFRNAGIILVSGIIKNCLLAGFLLLAFYRTLTGPLVDIGRFIHTYKASSTKQPRYKSRYPMHGELGILEKGLNGMLSEVERANQAREQIQSTVNELNLNLERKVKEKTLALAVATNKAVQANAAKSEFLATISHEVRTPMNAIIGLSNIALKSDDADTVQGHLESIQAAAQTLLSLFNDILDLSKIEANQLSVESIPFSVKALIADLEIIYSLKAREKRLSFDLTVDDAVPLLLVGDRFRLNQILTNLISNALKFTEKGRISVKIHPLADETLVAQPSGEPDSVYLHIEVQDTGIGIAKEKQHKLFEPFAQADMSTTRQYGGTGLGLAITKRLVELLGGTIQMDSEPGRGTLFQVIIPFARMPPHLAPSSAPDDQPPDKEELKQLQYKRVLVVEDIEINRFIVEDILQELGILTTSAVNGRDAVDKVKNQPFDLILMDLQMPVMDGYAATRIIRNEVDCQVPIIALTANATTEDKSKALTIGMTDFIVKPIDAKLLIQRMVKWIIRKR